MVAVSQQFFFFSIFFSFPNVKFASKWICIRRCYQSYNFKCIIKERNRMKNKIRTNAVCAVLFTYMWYMNIAGVEFQLCPRRHCDWTPFYRSRQPNQNDATLQRPLKLCRKRNTTNMSVSKLTKNYLSKEMCQACTTEIHSNLPKFKFAFESQQNSICILI